ncbi:MAG: hypothetical protein ACTHOK_15520 [Nocardioidaceae bacterium]
MSLSQDPGPVLVRRSVGGRLTLDIDPAADPSEVLAALSSVVSAPEPDPVRPVVSVPEQTPRHYAGEFLG